MEGSDRLVIAAHGVPVGLDGLEAAGAAREHGVGDAAVRDAVGPGGRARLQDLARRAGAEGALVGLRQVFRGVEGGDVVGAEGPPGRGRTPAAAARA